MAKELIKAPEDLSVWQNNIDRMAQRQPQLAQILQAYVNKHGHSMAHFENRTPTGAWIEGLTTEPFFQPDDDPVAGWNKKDKTSPIFFQYGVGTPPYLFKTIRQLPTEALSLIVVEPNMPLLVYLLHMTHVYSAMPANAVLVFITEPEEIPEGMRIIKDDGSQTDESEIPVELLWRAIRDEALSVSLTVQGIFSVRHTKSTIHNGEERAFGKQLADAAHAVREWVITNLNYLGNSSHDTMLGLRQMSLMSPWIVYGYQFKSLINEFRGRPFVIVNAGPSLAKNFDLLRDIGDRAVILANDAVLPKMLKAGMMPHAVCALERGIYTYEKFFADIVREYPEECSKILLIAQAVCTPKIYGLWPGPKMIVGKNEIPVDQWFINSTIEGETVQSGISVSHMCFGIATALGASSCALIGQDLAYGEDGVSHVSGIFDDTSLAQQSKGGTPGVALYKIPAALGGTVETHETWLSFLRLLETRTVVSAFPVYDCTEGGALIKGTIIEPFAQYIKDHIEGAPSIPRTPAEIVLSAGVVSDKAAKFDDIAENFTRAEEDTRRAEELIARVRETVARVGAPALTPKMRVALAAETAATLDKLNSVNPMFAFITQSYLYLATAEIAITRFLDTVENVRRWTALHDEIIMAHTAVIRFIDEQVHYARAALEWYVTHDLNLEPLDQKTSYARLADISERLGDGHDQVSLCCEMDDLFTRADLVRDGWDGEPMWQCANFLLQESRSEEALALMTEVEKLYSDTEMPVDKIKAFLKDYARISMTPDLCHMPNYTYARTILQNAEAYGVDDDTRAMRIELAEREQTMMIDVAMLFGSYKAEHLAPWYAARERAEFELRNGDILGAFDTIWQALKKYGRLIPRVAASHLAWLSAQVDRIYRELEGSEVNDENTKALAALDRLLDDIARDVSIFADMSVLITPTFASLLSSHGVAISVETADKEEVTTL